MAGRLKIYNDSTSTWEYIGGYGKAMPAGDVVGTSDTQTLTNKTLTSPTVNTPTLVLADSSPTADGSIGFDRTEEEIQIGDGTNSRAIHLGVWTSWTPSWSNLTVGNGTNTGAYTVIGKTVIGWFRFVFGSTSSISGSVSVTLPVSKRSNTGESFGQVFLLDYGSGNFEGRLASAGTIMVLNSGGSRVYRELISSTIPHTWATNDQISCYFTYEAA